MMPKSCYSRFTRALKWSRLVAALVCMGAGSSPSVCLAAADTPTRIELWRTGDDALTVRFATALEVALSKSGSFLVALGGAPRTPNTVILRIDENLKWKATDVGMTASYRISFEGPTGKSLGKSKGSCSDTDLDACTAQALRDTRRAAARLQ